MSEDQQLKVLIKQLDKQLPLPRYAHPGDAGADLYLTQDLSLEPGMRQLVGTGISIALPNGYVALIHPRSGLASRNGLTIVNSPGTVDAGYRGEIKICLLNTDRQNTIELHRGDAIAQMVIQRVEYAQFVLSDNLPDSERGVSGHGSSGGVSSWQR